MALFGFVSANPQETWDDAEKAPELGTLGSGGDDNGSGIYILVQSDGAITKGQLCAMEANYQIDQADDSDVAGTQYCIPQTALVDDEYGWGLVAGTGEVRKTAAAITASNYATVSSTAGSVVSGTATDTVSGLMLSANTSTSAGRTPCQVLFPKKVT